MIQQVQSLLNVWSVPFYAGWSFMRIFNITVLLIVISAVINFFFSKAGGGGGK
jgi:hypothetical protein